jgi:type VI secretion system secreted protein VgrG
MCLHICAPARAEGRLKPLRIGQEVLVQLLDNDIDRPVVIGSLYNGQGEAGVPATPGGQGVDADTSALAASSDHSPSAQGNLAGGHSPAWHGAAPGAATEGQPGQNNAAALSGIKSKEFGGSGFNQLVFDDSNQQLRTQLASTQHAIHQADNHRGSFRGLGFELRSDAYGAVRGGRGLLLSSFGTQASEPAGDNAAGIALAKQLHTLGQSFSTVAATHQSVPLAGHIGSSAAGQSGLSPTAAPYQALLTSLSGMVSPADMDQALSDAASDNTATGAGRLPHSSAPVLTVAAKAGLVQTAGQDLLYSANDTLTLASGQDTHLATGGAHRIHSGQAIGVLGGVIQAGQEAAGKGLTLIAAQGDTVLQAQAGPLQVASQGTLTVQSASAHIDWASAKKITLSTASGANITLEGGNITVQCPGTITVKAGTKSFAGGGSTQYDMPELATAGAFQRKFVIRRLTDQQPIADQKYRMTLAGGRVIEGVTNSAGETQLAQSEGMQAVDIEVLYD